MSLLLLNLVSYLACYKFNKKIDKEKAKRIFYGVLAETYFQLDEKELEEKLEEFWNTVYKQDKNVLLESAIPYINLIFALCHFVFDYWHPMAIHDGMDEYKREIVQMLSPATGVKETKQKSGSTYFLRLGQNGHFSTIHFAVDEKGVFEICDVCGPIGKQDERSQMIILNSALAEIYAGNVDGYGFSGNLPALLEKRDGVILEEDFGETSKGKKLKRVRNQDND
ncbi:MAG: hypothetical protein K2M17_00055 [Bacilli bacterium]|nr:hypothetical protein [Bacilli bacterium]